MRINWKKVFSRLLWLELLAMEPIKLLARGLYGFKVGVRRKLVAWVARAATLLFFLVLIHFILLFGLGALALYFNDLLESSYQGFLIVSGGCLVLLVLFWQLYRMRWPNNLM